ncbi:MAG: hypothetical protein HC897_08150 [Thermoanaerobaculia bacterium]|nr:hypothetical protein [Thermoanaerobaculia bacterium]
MRPHMTIQPFPLVILGGRDRHRSVLPDGGRDKHPLRGYKAVDTRIGDRTLIEVLTARLRATGAFAPIYVAGPRHVYEPLGMDVRLIDTDGEFGENLRAALEAVAATGWPQLVGFTTCDILPSNTDLQRALDDLEHQPRFDFWYPQCREPADPSRLGSSAWKPRYPIQPTGETRPVPTLPGHLLVVDPQALRLELIYRLFELAYRSRNRPVRFRRSWIMRHVFWALVREDLRRLFSLRVPNISWLVLFNGLTLVARLLAKKLSQRELEDRLHAIFARNRHSRLYPERRGSMPILDVLSLARDIDTEEEAREITGSFLRSETEA